VSLLFLKIAFCQLNLSIFEEREEEKRLEPMAPLLEILSSLKEGEEIWLQFIIRGLTKDQAKQFQSEAKKKIDELFGKKETPKQSGLQIFSLQQLKF